MQKPASFLAGLEGLFLGRRWTRPQIEGFQLERLRALVQHAYQRVPYYRRLFDQAAVRPEQIRTLRDLERIPITTRTTLQALPDSDILARGIDPRKLAVHRTSGSTGEPLSIRRTHYEDRLLQAYRLEILFRLGMRITDQRLAVVIPRLLKTPLYMKFGLLPYQEVACTLPPEQILSRVREIRPDVLRSYPTVLAYVADLMTDSDRKMIRPRLITTDSETLTTSMRERIRTGFGSEVVDFYDSHEFNMIAWECRSSGLYHASDRSMIAEVVSNERAVEPGEEGELIGTALHSWAMPFIRFRLGDLVTRGPGTCPCGVPNSILASVNGRILDRFRLPNGRSVHPYSLVSTLLSHGWIRQYQIVQVQLDSIKVELVPLAGHTPPPEAVAGIGHMLSEMLGKDIAVEVRLVAAIPPGPSGKARAFLPMGAATTEQTNRPIR